MGRIQLALVGIGGAAGALARWGIVSQWAGNGFPWATLVVNVVGCALLGVIVSRPVSIDLKRLLGTGFCGGLTTFSTFAVEIVQLLDQGSPGTAAAYVVASVATGLAVFVAARAMAAPSAAVEV